MFHRIAKVLKHFENTHLILSEIKCLLSTQTINDLKGLKNRPKILSEVQQYHLKYM